MNRLHAQHKINITWSMIEATIFQTLLLIHQYALFTLTGHHFYGLVGVIFGSLYFCVKLIDLGFNKIIASFFLDYSTHKTATRTFFTQGLIPNVLLYITVAFFFVYLMPFQLDTLVIVILLLLVLTESIKLNTKKILQLSHKFRQVALFEIASILCYQLIIWSYYYYCEHLTLTIVFGAFLATSAIESFYFSARSYQWYISLPRLDHAPSVNDTSVIKNRFFAYCHSMSKQLFSANTLIPLFAHSFGVETVAPLKLASYFIHSAISVIERIIEPSSAVLFAHIKNDPAESKQHFFSYASSVLHTMLSCLFVFCAINCTKLASFSHETSLSIFSCIMVYFVIHFIESFFIVIEKFYIAHDKSEFLLINTLFNALFAVLTFVYAVSPFISLVCLCAARIISFFASLTILSLFWKIRHSFIVHSSYIIGTLIAALVFFIIF